MFKTIIALACLAAPVQALAFTDCALTPLTGTGGNIAEEGANPVYWKGWIYAGFMDKATIGVISVPHGGGNPGTPVILFQGKGTVKSLRLAADVSNVYALWNSKVRSTTRLMFDASHKNGVAGSWAAPVDLGGSNGQLPQITVEGKDVHIAYFNEDGVVQVLNSTDAGKTFSEPVTLANGWGEIVTISSGKNVYVAWNIEPATKRFEVELAVSNDGGKTFSLKNMSETRPSNAEEPIFTIDRKSGRVSLIWREGSPLAGVYMNSTDSGHTWSAPLSIDDPARQFMVADDGNTIYVSYLKELSVDGVTDWQVQLATSTDGGKTFPNRQNLSGPTGIAKIEGDNFRPIPWVRDDGAFRLTAVKADGVYAWNGKNSRISAAAYLGQGMLAAPAFNSAVWRSPTGVVTYAVCR